ncbi:hypothetical protein EV127DRAFT_120256 [Xylaria flabelliformis]|nr:hypothetical protein EV127DRAFT_120256 [Xylaria flabelliformis]
MHCHWQFLDLAMIGAYFRYVHCFWLQKTYSKSDGTLAQMVHPSPAGYRLLERAMRNRITTVASGPLANDRSSMVGLVECPPYRRPPPPFIYNKPSLRLLLHLFLCFVLFLAFVSTLLFSFSLFHDHSVLGVTVVVHFKFWTQWEQSARPRSQKVYLRPSFPFLVHTTAW